MEYKISFCITCMNRLSHLQETLPKNIHDNYLLGDVEFVLLDYNSSDGLESWVNNDMKKYIDLGILSYYKTFEPNHYLRSHSRNVVFRLANGNIVCNLDADNFLGRGFAKEMINEFEKAKGIFYTSDLQSTDIYGRVCLLKKDFINLRGYDESLIGYGHEDADLFSRLKEFGLRHLYYENQNYNVSIKHSKFERINNEPIYKKLYLLYISYINPYTTEILLIYNDSTLETGILVDSKILLIQKSLSKFIRGNDRVVLKNNIRKGRWKRISNNTISLMLRKVDIIIDTNNKSFCMANGKQFYEVTDEDLKISLIVLISMALNERKSIESIEKCRKVNQMGFGNCTVYKNFNYNDFIDLK
jgi:hypothetical protein